MRTAIRVAMLMCSITPAIAGAPQSSSRQHARRPKQQVRKSQPQPDTTRAPAPLSEQPSPPSLVVSVYEQGALSITAEDATLREIFDSIRESTGAAIDVPASEEHFSVRLGPQPPVQVIAGLLEGTHLNYAILGGTGPGDRVLRIIVMPKPAGGPPAPNPNAEEVAARARARPEMRRPEVGGDEAVWDNKQGEPPARAPATAPPVRAREH